MAFTERLRLIIDVVAPSGGGLGNLKKDISDAEGAFGKLKTAGAGAFDFLKQNAASVALGLGTALVGIGTKAVGDFQALALSAGKLTDSLGVTADEASRLQEVAGDLSIPVETLEASIGKMNRAAAMTPQAFDAIGAAIVRNADGTVNVTETFLSAVEALNRIPDATKRAEAAQKIFGRGWMQMAEMIGLGADGIRQAMASVEEGKIVTEDQIADAKSFRDTLDELKGIVEEASVELGGKLVPALESVAEAMIVVSDAVDLISDAVDAIPDPVKDFLSWTNPIGQIQHAISGLTTVMDENAGVTGSVKEGLEAATPTAEMSARWANYADVIAEGADAVREASGAGRRYADFGKVMADAAKEAADAEKELNDALRDGADALQEATDARRAAADAQFALDDARRDFADLLAEEKGLLEDEATTMQDLARWQDEVAQSAGGVADNLVRLAEETATANGEILTAAESGRIWGASMLESASIAQGPARDAILEYVATVEGIPPEKMTEITAAVNAGDLALAQQLLDEASRVRHAEILATALTKAADGDLTDLTEEERVALIDAFGGDFNAAETALQDLTEEDRNALIDAVRGGDTASSFLEGIRARDRNAPVDAVPGNDQASYWINRIAAPRTAYINVVAVGTSAAAGAIAGAAGARSVTPTAAGPTATATATAAPAPVAVTPQAAQPIIINVPAPKPTSVTINAGVVGNRHDVERVVARSLRAYGRLNGGPV